MESKHDTMYFQSLIGHAELTKDILKSIQNKSSGNDGENYFNANLSRKAVKFASNFTALLYSFRRIF